MLLATKRIVAGSFLVHSFLYFSQVVGLSQHTIHSGWWVYFYIAVDLLLIDQKWRRMVECQLSSLFYLYIYLYLHCAILHDLHVLFSLSPCHWIWSVGCCCGSNNPSVCLWIRSGAISHHSSMMISGALDSCPCSCSCHTCGGNSGGWCCDCDPGSHSWCRHSSVWKISSLTPPPFSFWFSISLFHLDLSLWAATPSFQCCLKVFLLPIFSLLLREDLLIL